MTIDAFCAVCGEGIVWYDERPLQRRKAGWRHVGQERLYGHRARPTAVAS